MNKHKAIRNMVHWIIVFGLMSLFFVSFTTLASVGEIVNVTIHSQALEGNLLGDSPTRSVLIYLPPVYEDNLNTRYPVIYLLHGYYNENNLWKGVKSLSMKGLFHIY